MSRVTAASGRLASLFISATVVASPAAAQVPASEDALLARLAIELAADRDAVPISLDADGRGLHGVVYDRFSQMHLAARVAARKGTPLDPAKLLSAPSGRQLIVVAVPIVCGARTVAPADVDMDNGGRVVPKWQPATGSMLKTLLPGATTPPGAIGVMFADTSLRQGETVQITYAGPVCTGTSKTVSLPVSLTAARALDRPVLELPAGEPAPSAPVTVMAEAVVNLEGHLRYPSAPSAPAALGRAAVAAAAGMRFEPSRINGTPTPMTAGVILTFTAAAPTAGTATPSGGPLRALPPDARVVAPIAAGSSTPETVTQDVPQLTAASSRCAISDDPTYGVTSGNAIKIGGGGAGGAARTQPYLAALRGPAGQGLRYRLIGPVLAMDRQTLLEMFEVRYAGLESPIRLFLDTTHAETPLAPKGLVCAAPIGIK